MQSLSSWATEDQKHFCIFQSLHLNHSSSIPKSMILIARAGGLLLGSVHRANCSLSKQRLILHGINASAIFSSGCPSAMRPLLFRWKASEGTVRYLGEWHTHPENHPKPSRLDKVEWIDLSSRRSDKRPMFAVIVGRENLYVELISSSKCGLVTQSLE